MATEVRVTGLKEMASALRRIDPALAKQLSRAHKEISTDISERARSNVSGITDAGGRGAAGIRPRATTTKASIALLGSNPFVRAAVFGAKTHHVFGRPMPAVEMARPVWQPWIGKDWDVETDLYGVSPALVEMMPRILETYADRVMDALDGAFPN